MYDVLYVAIVVFRELVFYIFDIVLMVWFHVEAYSNTIML